MCIRDRGDALAGLRVERAGVGNAMQAEEGLQRVRRIGEDLEEVGNHAQSRLDGVEQSLLLGVGGLGGNKLDAGHDVSPV